MNQIKRDLYVDSGNIFLLNLTEIEKVYGLRSNRKDYTNCTIQWTVDEVCKSTGMDCRGVNIKNTWVGDINIPRIHMFVKNGDVMFLGDACYVVKEWSRFCDEVIFGFSEHSKWVYKIDTGGDGVFVTTVV